MSGRSAVICEVCGGRTRHDNRSIVVGRRPGGIKRMVCGSTTCLRKWRLDHPAKEQDVAPSNRIPAMGLAVLQNRVWSTLNKRPHGWISALAREVKKNRPDLFNTTEGGIRAAIHRVLEQGPPKLDTPPMPVVNQEMGHGAVPAGTVVEKVAPSNDSPFNSREMRLLDKLWQTQESAGLLPDRKGLALARLVRVSSEYLAEIGDIETLKVLASLATEALVK